MRTWKQVLKEAEMKEIEALNAGLQEDIVKEVKELRAEAEELKPVVRYTLYGFDNGEYRDRGKVMHKLITSPAEAMETMMEFRAKAMTCEVDGEKQHIQLYNIEGEWYALILGMGRTLQSIGTEWAKNMKKSIKMYSFGRYEQHEAIYNEDFETVSFA